MFTVICERRVDPKADYDSNWSTTFDDRTLISVTQCWESSILFVARKGQVVSEAPLCNKEECCNKICTSYCSQRGKNGKANYEMRLIYRKVFVIFVRLAFSYLTSCHFCILTWTRSSF